MTFIREKLEEMNLPKLTLNGIMSSNALKYIEQIIEENNNVCDKEVLSQLKRIADTYENASQRAEEIVSQYQNAVSKSQYESRHVINELREMTQKYEKAKEQSDGLITDKKLADAVKAYKAVLEATKEVFGEKCTESVITASIEAGSFTAWRGIMGPKYKTHLREDEE